MGNDGSRISDEGLWRLKGKGTYNGKAGADGFEDQVEGDSVMPAEK